MRSAALALTALLLAGCGGGETFMTIDGDQFTEPTALADSSEYLVRATLVDEPESHRSDAMRWWVAESRIDEVVAQRPDAPVRLSAGMTIPIGTWLLDADESYRVSNASEWPGETDRPHAGDQVVAFLVRQEMDGYGVGYAAAGQAVVGDGGSVRMRALPGPLNHDVLSRSRTSRRSCGTTTPARLAGVRVGDRTERRVGAAPPLRSWHHAQTDGHPTPQAARAGRAHAAPGVTCPAHATAANESDASLVLTV